MQVKAAEMTVETCARYRSHCNIEDHLSIETKLLPQSASFNRVWFEIDQRDPFAAGIKHMIDASVDQYAVTALDPGIGKVYRETPR